jgi:hypothetical protein
MCEGEQKIFLEVSDEDSWGKMCEGEQEIFLEVSDEGS